MPELAEASARRALTVLLVFINNPNSISPGAGDPRFSTLLGVGLELQRRGHTVLIDGAGSISWPRYKSYPKDRSVDLLRPFPWLPRSGVDVDVAIIWFNYAADVHTSKHPLVLKILRNSSLPRLVYENGMTRGSVTVDPMGLLGDSFYVPTLNARAQQVEDDDACKAHVQQQLARDMSKRPQPTGVIDVPSSTLSRYVFIPTQKFDDVSVMRYSTFTYPQLLFEATKFCQAHGLPLVIKIHPHLQGKERAAQEQLIAKLRGQYAQVFESNASINFLTANAHFTVTLNGGTIMDNLRTQSPVLSLARGLFQDTDAVVTRPSPDASLQSSMRRMHHKELPWSEERRKRARQLLCWYEQNSLHVNSTPAANVAVLQGHLEALATVNELARLVKL